MWGKLPACPARRRAEKVPRACARRASCYDPPHSMNRCRTFLALLLLVVWLPYHAHAAGIEFDDDDAPGECHCSGHDMAGGSAPLKMSAPPIVGVPALTRCVCGPSSRTDWPIFNDVSLRIIHGPMMNEIASAVSAAITVRSVMY